MIKQRCVEQAHHTAHSASSSCQFRRIAGTFDARVSLDVERQSLDVRENGQCMGPKAKGLRDRQKRFFRVARHSAKTSFNTSFDTPWHSPQTQTRLALASQKSQNGPKLRILILERHEK